MAYGINVRERAFALYLQGQNAEQIAETLRAEYPSLSANTIRSWEEDADDRGETWEDRRRAVDQASRRRIEAQAATMRATTAARLQTLTEVMYNRLTSKNSPEMKTFEGAVYAFKALSEMAVKLDDDDQNRFNPFVAAEILLQALSEDAEVRKVLKIRWSHVKGVFASKLNGLTRTKEIEVQPSIEKEAPR